MRWDLDGDGGPATSSATDYAAAFPNPLTATATVTVMGCPTGDHDGDSNTPERTGCAGYELAADLDFDEDGDGDRNDTYNTGSGWSPIGDDSNQFNGVFEGNGHDIANLYMSASLNTGYLGLFGHAGPSAVIRNLGLTDVNVAAFAASGSYIGGLVGRNRGTVTASYATGSVSGGRQVGGLVGENYQTSLTVRGSVTASYSAVDVTGGVGPVGGLVGVQRRHGPHQLRHGRRHRPIAASLSRRAGGAKRRVDHRQLRHGQHHRRQILRRRWRAARAERLLVRVVASYATGSISERR